MTTKSEIHAEIIVDDNLNEVVEDYRENRVPGLPPTIRVRLKVTAGGLELAPDHADGELIFSAPALNPWDFTVTRENALRFNRWAVAFGPEVAELVRTKLNELSLLEIFRAARDF